MIEEDSAAADGFAGSAQGYGARSARQMGEGAGAGGQKISAQAQRRVRGGGDARAGECQVVELVGARARHDGAIAAQGDGAGIAVERPVVGPISTDGVSETISNKCGSGPQRHAPVHGEGATRCEGERT